MSTATNKIDVCRLALDFLDQDAEEVTSIDSPTTELEKICARWYDVSRRAELRNNVWNFAKARDVLTKASTPGFGYDDAYNIPNDYLRLVALGDDEDFPEVDFEIEGNQILIDNNAGDLKIRYIFDQTNVVRFDSLFVELCALRMARNMAKKITGSDTIAGKMIDVYDKISPSAYAVDGQERPPQKVNRSPWRAARRGRSRNVAKPYYETT